MFVECKRPTVYPARSREEGAGRAVQGRARSSEQLTLRYAAILVCSAATAASPR
ncbi:hypothetical protein J6590_091499, partial [Homalodisca vitripennis]